jgi:NADH-quinone oxidoreductase subunit N
MTHDTVLYLLPEIVLVAVAVAIYMVGAFRESEWGWNVAALAGVAAAAVALALVQHHPAGGNTVLKDDFSLFLRWFALALAGLYVLLNFKPLPSGGTSESLGSLLLIVAGAMLAGEAADLVLVFVGLELVSIPTYILLYLGRRDEPQREAAAKYFYLSVLSSALLLYGFSFLYGATGSTDLPAMLKFFQAGKIPQGFEVFAKAAAALVVAGLSFRLTAVPFHFYAPDVYQGTTHANAALLSVIPKLAGLAVLVRIVWWIVPDDGHVALWIAASLALLSMTFGNLVALWQDNLRRLMAYSSIAHAGYLLVGFTAAMATRGAKPGSWDGLGAVWFYLCVYAAATVGTFAVFEYLGRRDRRLEGIDELAGLGRIRPSAAAMLAVFMFSLTGIPILAGFWGKFQVLGAAMFVDPSLDPAGHFRTLFLVLAVVGVLNAAVSAAYYLRIVAVMYFRSPLGTPPAEGGRGPWLAAFVCCLLTLGIGLFPGPLLRESNRARPQLENPAPAEHNRDVVDSAK